MNIKKARKATPFTVAVAIAIWILAGCSTSAPASSPVAHASVGTQATTPAQQALAWKKGPGGAAFKKLARDMDNVSDPTQMSPNQAKLITSDIKAAEAYPLPQSADPGGYYLDALIHLRKGMVAIQNVQVFDALAQMSAANSDVKHLKTEVKGIF